MDEQALANKRAYHRRYMRRWRERNKLRLKEYENEYWKNRTDALDPHSFSIKELEAEVQRLKSMA